MNHRVLMSSLIVNAIFVALIWKLERDGFVATAWNSDVTLITPIMVLISVVVFVAVGIDVYRRTRRNLHMYNFVAGLLPMLGMVGTIYGFSIALGGIKEDAVGDISNIGPMIAALGQGMGIAIWTTLTGIFLFIHLACNIQLANWLVDDEE